MLVLFFFFFVRIGVVQGGCQTELTAWKMDLAMLKVLHQNGYGHGKVLQEWYVWTYFICCLVKGIKSLYYVHVCAILHECTLV